MKCKKRNKKIIEKNRIFRFAILFILFCVFKYTIVLVLYKTMLTFITFVITIEIEIIIFFKEI